MGINDYGGTGDALNSPPLGGPGGWAEAVAAVLNGSDETVDDRIADRGIRITRPNVDDRLVEQWNGSAWSVVDYDSGWRDVASLLDSDALAKFQTWATAHIRVTRDQVRFAMRGTIGTGTAAGTGSGVYVLPLASELAAYEFCTVAMGNDGYGTKAFSAGFSASRSRLDFAPPVGNWGSSIFSASGTWDRSTPGPLTSLPGTLVTPAPQ